MSLKVPELPALSPRVPTEIRRALMSIYGYLHSSSKAGGFATQVALDQALKGVSDELSGATGTAPGKPVNFRTRGGFDMIMLLCDPPNPAWRVSYVEWYRAEVDDFDAAVLCATTATVMHPDFPPNNELGKTWYYWCRYVNAVGEGPLNDLAGTPGTTATDPAYLLEMLTGQITSSELYADLMAQIDKIDPHDVAIGQLIDAITDEDTGLDAKASTIQLQQAVADAEAGIVAAAVDQVSTELGQDYATAQARLASVDGLNAQITFKIDNNGFPAGGGWSSEPIDGEVFSQFISLADRHAFVNPAAATLVVSSITRSGATVTVTTSAAHGLEVGGHVVIVGAAQHQYNGSHKVTQIVSPTQFRFTIVGTPVTPATVREGFPGLRAKKAVVPLVVQDGRVVINTLLVEMLTAANFVGGKVVADELTATLATSYQQIIGWLLKSADGQVQLDMVNKFLKMTSVLNHQVELTPGTIKFWRSGSAAPLFEFNGSSVIMRDPDGTVLLRSGGNIDYARVGGTKPPANADNTASNTSYDTVRVGGDFASKVVRAGNRISSNNQATYIDSLVVPEAWIGNLAVTRGKIAHLAVDTLQIGENAVVLPVTATGSTSASAPYVIQYNDKLILIAQVTFTAQNLQWYSGTGDGYTEWWAYGWQGTAVLKRGTTILASQGIHMQGTGNYTLTLVAFNQPGNGTYTYSVSGGNSCNLSIFGAKK